MLIAIPPKMSVSRFMGILKGKSALMIFDRFANLKYKFGNRHFWCRGYFVDTVGRNKNAIQKYIQNQLAEDKTIEQISMKEYMTRLRVSRPKKASKRPPGRAACLKPRCDCQVFRARFERSPVSGPYRA